MTIGAHMGFASVSTTHMYLCRLQREGRLSSLPGQPRTLRVVA